MTAQGETVTVSSKFQVVIPERVRRDQHIHPGDKMAVIVKHGILHLVPIRPWKEIVGMTPGLDTKDLRDRKDRF